MPRRCQRDRRENGGYFRARDLGLGGTTRPRFTGELALRYCLANLGRAGVHTEIVTAQDLQLPMYDPTSGSRASGAQRLVDAAYRVDAVLVASPSYHASVSGLVKNALDYGLLTLRPRNVFLSFSHDGGWNYAGGHGAQEDHGLHRRVVAAGGEGLGRPVR